MAGTHDAPQSAIEALLQNLVGEENDIREPQSRNEALLKELLESGFISGTASSVDYLTEPPTSANTDGGLKFVVLLEEPANKYDGYIYFILSDDEQE